jgi:hypothetical protein
MSDNVISCITVQRIDIPGRWLVIPVDKIAFVFLGAAATRGLIDAPWAGAGPLAPRTVYVRTFQGALFQTGFATLDELRRRLEPTRFVSIHRLMIANVNRVVELDLAAHVSRIGVLVGNNIEFLSVSRRCLRALRERIGFPKRVKRGRKSSVEPIGREQEKRQMREKDGGK